MSSFVINVSGGAAIGQQTSNTNLASASNVLQSISYFAEKVCKNKNCKGSFSECLIQR